MAEHSQSEAETKKTDTNLYCQSLQTLHNTEQTNQQKLGTLPPVLKLWY